MMRSRSRRCKNTYIYQPAALSRQGSVPLSGRLSAALVFVSACWLASSCWLAPGTAAAALAGAAENLNETPANFDPRVDSFDYVKREVMIPMRDGVKLHTLILIPRGAARAPMLLTRTPYGAANRISPGNSAHLSALIDSTDVADDAVVSGGYIRVVQDIRGKHGSEGDYVMARPLQGLRAAPRGAPPCARKFTSGPMAPWPSQRRRTPGSSPTSPIRQSRCPTCPARFTSTARVNRDGKRSWSAISAMRRHAPMC
jgi:hypothetical protein